MPGSTHAYRLASSSRAASDAREAVRSSAGDLSRELLSDVLLCVTELVTNSVTYPDVEEGEELELTMVRDDGVLRVEVAERSRGVRVGSARRFGGDGGHDLYLVELLADRWGEERGSLRRIWFEKDVAS